MVLSGDGSGSGDDGWWCSVVMVVSMVMFVEVVIELHQGDNITFLN